MRWPMQRPGRERSACATDQPRDGIDSFAARHGGLSTAGSVYDSESMSLASRERNSDDGGNRRMAPNRARLVVGLLTAFLWGFSSAAAEETARQLHVEAEFPQRGDFMCVGFGSLWMMSDQKLMRVALADNAVTEIPVIGDATGELHRTVVGEGAVWVADNQTIYKIDPKTNLVVMTIPADFPVNVGEAARNRSRRGSSLGDHWQQL